MIILMNNESAPKRGSCPSLPCRPPASRAGQTGRHAGGKNGASDLSQVTVNSDNYPDIYVGGNNTKTKGIYANLTFSEWAQ